MVFLILTRNTIFAGTRERQTISHNRLFIEAITFSRLAATRIKSVNLSLFSASGLQENTFYNDLSPKNGAHVKMIHGLISSIVRETKHKNSDVRGLHCACGKIGKPKNQTEPILRLACRLRLDRVINKKQTNSKYKMIKTKINSENTFDTYPNSILCISDGNFKSSARFTLSLQVLRRSFSPTIASYA